MGQSACIDLGGGQQQREIQLLSDANSTVGKFLQASTQAKMHVQVRRFSGQHRSGQKNPFILVMNYKLDPSRVETVVNAVLLTFVCYFSVLRNRFFSLKVVWNELLAVSYDLTVVFFFVFFSLSYSIISTLEKILDFAFLSSWGLFCLPKLWYPSKPSDMQKCTSSDFKHVLIYNFSSTQQIMSSCIFVTRGMLLHSCDIFSTVQARIGYYDCSSDPHLTSPSCLISLTGAAGAPWAVWSTIAWQKRALSCSAALNGSRRTSVSRRPLGVSRSLAFTTPPCKEVCHG